MIDAIALGRELGADPTGLVRPRFGRSCFSDLLPSVAARLGVGAHENTLDLPSGRRWVVVLVDGLGWLGLHRTSAAAPYLSSLLPAGRPITAAIPSTTSTSLTSLGTGSAPGHHGMVGYTFRLPGAKGAILNALTWELPHAPRTVQPVPTVFEELVAAGVEVSTVSLARFSDSALSQAALAGPRFHGLHGDADDARRVELIAGAAQAGDSSLVYAYERRLDHHGHGHGCGSAGWVEQLRRVDTWIAELRSRLDDDVAIVVTGDHGMVDVPQERQVLIEAQPDLRAGLDAIAGEGRFRQLYVDHESPAAVAARWAEHFGDDAWVRTRDEAIDDGWFGPVADRVRERLGHVLVAMRTDRAAMSSTFPGELGLVGMHGSLTPAEMAVPLLIG
ncbi:alkaline phosphatase family protein [Propionibacteriaceae bacterium Y1685]